MLLIAQTARANGIAIEAFYYGDIFYNLILFTFGFALEWICVIALGGRSTKNVYSRAFICTLALNIASVLGGIVFKVQFAKLFINFLTHLNNLINAPSLNGTFVASLLSALGIYLLYVIINTIIEVPIASYFFPSATMKQVWFWIGIANCLSMGAITLFYLYGFHAGFSQLIIK